MIYCSEYWNMKSLLFISWVDKIRVTSLILLAYVGVINPPHLKCCMKVGKSNKSCLKFLYPDLSTALLSSRRNNNLLRWGEDWVSDMHNAHPIWQALAKLSVTFMKLFSCIDPSASDAQAKAAEGQTQEKFGHQCFLQSKCRPFSDENCNNVYPWLGNMEMVTAHSFLFKSNDRTTWIWKWFY